MKIYETHTTSLLYVLTPVGRRADTPLRFLPVQVSRLRLYAGFSDVACHVIKLTFIKREKIKVQIVFCIALRNVVQCAKSFY